MCLSCFSCHEPANRANVGQLRGSSKRSTNGGGNREGRSSRVCGSPEDLTPKLLQTARSHQSNSKVPGFEEEEKEKRVDDGNMQKRNNIQRDHLVISISSSSNEEDECIILNSNLIHPHDLDFGHKVPLSYYDSSGFRVEDVGVISERGQVACRDYPHSRQHCGKFPFNKTPHERCCPQCYCYVCDLEAPCKSWKGRSGHCHASDQDPKWRDTRISHRENFTDN